MKKTLKQHPRSVGLTRGLHRVFALLAAFALAGLTADAQTTNIAYVVTAGTAGNQNFGGGLGMDFDVQNPIIVTQIGVFDDLSDGLMLPITAKLYDRATLTELVTMEFTPEDSGTLIGGSRFKPLTSPLRLEVGFQGTIFASGYGAEERLRNTLNVIANYNWTTNDGAGSLAFVGASRYGVDATMYPDTVDEGPADRYCAGTFQYVTTPALAPGQTTLKLAPADKQISLEWTVITTPLAAATYRVLRATKVDGPFTQIAEVSTNNYVDTNLANGTVLYYVVRGVASNGKEGVDSAVKFTAPYVLPTDTAIAHLLPMGTPGTQAFNGPLGLDFLIQNAINVTHLGVFDDLADGIKLPLTVRLWDRSTQTELASLDFTPDNAGTLIEGMRFKALPSPVRLEPGFQGTISGEGYGAEERDYNVAAPNNMVQSRDGNGSVKYVGTGRWGTELGVFPPNADGGPYNRYGTGTFEFQLTTLTKPGIPTLSLQLPAGDKAITLLWQAITNPLPAVKYQVLRAASASGPFTQVGETSNLTYTDTGLANGTEVFYVIRSVAENGQASIDSNMVSGTPHPRAAGVAYNVTAGIVGNQAYGGALGMDFDVALPVKVTKLGVFDSGADGLFLTLHAVLFDRATRTALATLEFTPEVPGDLVDANRFKVLPQPLTLPAGFQGTIAAYGYGTDEQNFNSGNRPDDNAQLTTFDGGSLVFVGTSRYGSATDPSAYPTGADGGPANRYGSGTFYFEPLAEAAKLSISLANGKVKITWTGAGVLEKAATLPGTWQTVTGATSGVEIPVEGNAAFFRVKN